MTRGWDTISRCKLVSQCFGRASNQAKVESEGRDECSEEARAVLEAQCLTLTWACHDVREMWFDQGLKCRFESIGRCSASIDVEQVDASKSKGERHHVFDST